MAVFKANLENIVDPMAMGLFFLKSNVMATVLL